MLKMRKLLLFGMILTSMTALCQNEVVSAVLQTGSEVKYYTGADALVRAYNDAEQSGSVITLTAGSFSFIYHEVGGYLRTRLGEG